MNVTTWLIAISATTSSPRPSQYGYVTASTTGKPRWITSSRTIVSISWSRPSAAIPSGNAAWSGTV